MIGFDGIRNFVWIKKLIRIRTDGGKIKIRIFVNWWNWYRLTRVCGGWRRTRRRTRLSSTLTTSPRRRGGCRLSFSVGSRLMLGFDSKRKFSTSLPPGLWIRIHFLRTRIQRFFLMRIRIQLLFKCRSGSSFKIFIKKLPLWKKTCKIAQK